MDRNSLKNEVIRAQDILNQIRMRFTAEFQINARILDEIRLYKEKLKSMEDERTQSLIEIEKHLSIIAKTNEELRQRLAKEDKYLHSANGSINQVNSVTEGSQHSEQIDGRNLASFSNAFTSQRNEDASNGATVMTPSRSSNLEKYLQDLYKELCIRVQAQQNKASTKEPGAELNEIKALLDEGEKRLQTLSAMDQDDLTNDTATVMTLAADQSSNQQGGFECSIQDEWLDTEGPAPLIISSPKPENENAQKTGMQENSRPPPVLHGWVNTPETSTPPQDPTRDSLSVGNKSLDDSREPPSTEESQKIPSPSPRPVGPVRASTFQADQTDTTAHCEDRHLGKGRDYFEEMFQNAQDYFNLSHNYRIGKSHHVSKATTPPLFSGYNATTSSAIGNLCILEINEEGKFVRLYNANRKEAEIGNYMIKQNVGGHPVIVFRFPPRTKFPQNSIITVWAALCDNDVFHDPPGNYIWDTQVKWGVGPEFTTILCKPNGQAIAWTNAAHRFNPHLSPEIPMIPVHIRMMQRSPATSQVETKSCSRNEIAFDVRNPSHTWEKNLVFLKRRKQNVTPAPFTKHPHGLSPGSPVHPCAGKERDAKGYASPPCTRDLKKSSRILITKRCNNANGSHTVSQPTLYASSKNRNNSNKNHSKKPGIDLLSCVAFMKPSTRLQYGLELIRAQYDMTYKPPMPKLSRSAW